MSRTLVVVMVALSALGSVAIGSAIARSNAADPDSIRAYTTRADFDLAFAEAAALPRGNTPANRERLRELGWKRLNASR